MTALKQNIKKIGVATLWIVLAAGLMVLLAAAINKKDHKTCKAIDIDISGTGEYYFLDRQDVMNIIGINKQNKPEGRLLSSFNLQKLESTLESNVWIKDAELFFDNNLILHINVEERKPVARIFTVMNNSFYIDSSGKKLPLSNKMNVQLPVFTHYTAERTNNLDSSTRQELAGIKKLSLFLANDSFWMARIAQVDIIAGRTFELLPTVGNHIIEFGDGNNCTEKFKRLSLFYKNILSKTGYDKYSRIDIRFENQVIGTRRGSLTKVDSLQALSNVQKMIAASLKIPDDTLSTSVEKNNVIIKKPNSTLPVIKKSNNTK